jgi:hypothetical protein
LQHRAAFDVQAEIFEMSCNPIFLFAGAAGWYNRSRECSEVIRVRFSMSDLTEASIPLAAATNTASLGLRLTFKLLAWLHEVGKLDRDEVEAIAGGLIAELGSDQERFEQWQMLRDWVPALKTKREEASKPVAVESEKRPALAA